MPVPRSQVYVCMLVYVLEDTPPPPQEERNISRDKRGKCDKKEERPKIKGKFNLKGKNYMKKMQK
jgi:hypothetical protein